MINGWRFQCIRMPCKFTQSNNLLKPHAYQTVRFFSYFPLVFILNSSPLNFFFVGVNAIVIMFGVLFRTKQSFTSYSFRANKMVLILATKPKELSLTSHGWRGKLTLSNISLTSMCIPTHTCTYISTRWEM